jgi:UDP-N-acetylmuramoylalanine--D-glutamate ligase
MANKWQGKRVLILGAARQGLALSRYLTAKKALVTLNDRSTAEHLGLRVSDLTLLGINLVLGEHPLSLLDQTETVCISGGIPMDLPLVKKAVESGINLTNDSQIFMEEVKATVIGITGSAGKTTTTTLVGRIAQVAVATPNKAWIGGNIGLPLVEYLDEIQRDDLVILELSSFQLEQMTISPHIAVVLNITPNHLDRHGTMDAYAAAKSNILKYQCENDIVILNREDSGSWALRSSTKASLISFGLRPISGDENGSYIDNGSIYLRQNGVVTKVLELDEITLRGQHNLMNVLAAVAISSAAAFPVQSMRSGIIGFAGVEHRLEIVRELRGITWVNDSKATTPQGTLAALESFTEPIVLLLGGRDKHLPWEALASRVHQRVSHVILFGEATGMINAALGKPVNGETLKTVIDAGPLLDAMKTASDIAVSGDVVLLSPGCTSYDAFKDFEERGNYFKNWVNGLR